MDQNTYTPKYEYNPVDCCGVIYFKGFNNLSVNNLKVWWKTFLQSRDNDRNPYSNSRHDYDRLYKTTTVRSHGDSTHAGKMHMLVLGSHQWNKAKHKVLIEMGWRQTAVWNNTYSGSICRSYMWIDERVELPKDPDPS